MTLATDIKNMLMSKDEQTFLLGLSCLTQCDLSEFEEKDFAKSPNVIININYTNPLFSTKSSKPLMFKVRSSIFHIKDTYRENVLFLEENKSILEKFINLKINIEHTQIFESYKLALGIFDIVSLTYL